ncbi:MAG: hypothetical protein V1663_04360 [archaeon]
MKSLRYFEDFLKEGIVHKYQPDFSRARFLIRESERKRESMNEFIEKVGLSDLNAHDIIENCYDILIGLIRAKLCKDGFKSSGEGAHEAEVAYLRNLQFSENTIQFMDQIRYFRNGIKYYGKIFDREYAEKVLNFLSKIYPRLIKIAKGD